MKKKKHLTRTERSDAHPAQQHAATVCAHCERVETRLNTLIVWMAQSASSPISVREAEILINEVGQP